MLKHFFSYRQPPELMAAIDLGSNSFHMIIVRVSENGQIHVIDRLREMVQLASGLDENKNLSVSAQGRALTCLALFGQRLRGFPAGSVRAVGTNTLRTARNSDAFLRDAEAALGHSIDIIAGREEARLIYQGVAHSLSDMNKTRLVMDIGGGSTEFIIGQGFVPSRRESLYMGCVTMTRRHFPDGLIKPKYMRRAEVEAHLEAQAISHDFHAEAWEQAIGASGTIRAIGKIVQNEGWCKRGITYKSLQELRTAVINAGNVTQLKLKGLSAERAPVFPGGLAVLIGAFEELGIERMEVSDGALREGLIYDLLGRFEHKDICEDTVQAFMKRYEVNQDQAQRVEKTAISFLEQVSETWELNTEEHALFLGRAARLHEIGLSIAHNQYHKHGEYLLTHSDLAGFSRQEQTLLAVLVRGHRRKFPLEAIALLPEAERRDAVRLCVLLRLAVLLYRNRHAITLPELRLQASGESLNLIFPDAWLEQHTLVKEDLENEKNHLANAGIEFTFIALPTASPEP